MTPTISVFRSSPDCGRGLARDMAVRWALEEVGQPYEVRLLSFDEMKQPDHIARHPFGQIPTYEDGNFRLFESGAIVLHISEDHGGLLPAEPAARARAINWVFAALSTIEPPILELANARILEHDRESAEARVPIVEERASARLAFLSEFLGHSEWLDGQFTAGDLIMVAVLRRLKLSGLLTKFPNLAAYVGRGETRPAFARAFADQLAIFTASCAEA